MYWAANTRSDTDLLIVESYADLHRFADGPAGAGRGDLRLMAGLVDHLVDPAIRRYPELAVDEEGWKNIAAERASLRAAR